jgi:hypothetical protein
MGPPQPYNVNPVDGFGSKPHALAAVFLDETNMEHGRAGESS